MVFVCFVNFFSFNCYWLNELSFGYFGFFPVFACTFVVCFVSELKTPPSFF